MPYVGNFMAKIARVRMFPFPTGVWILEICLK
jgi:hypothetical protein